MIPAKVREDIYHYRRMTKANYRDKLWLKK